MYPAPGNGLYLERAQSPKVSKYATASKGHWKLIEGNGVPKKEA